MGMIILPFLVGALGLSVFALIKTVQLLRSSAINGKELFSGLAISVSLFGLLCLSYLIEGKAWALSPGFRIPIFMIFIPFGVYLLFRASKNPKLKSFATLVLISIGLSGILGIIFYEFFFVIIDILGVEHYY